VKPDQKRESSAQEKKKESAVVVEAFKWFAAGGGRIKGDQKKQRGGGCRWGEKKNVKTVSSELDGCVLLGVIKTTKWNKEKQAKLTWQTRGKTRSQKNSGKTTNKSQKKGFSLQRSCITLVECEVQKKEKRQTGRKESSTDAISHNTTKGGDGDFQKLEKTEIWTCALGGRSKSTVVVKQAGGDGTGGLQTQRALKTFTEKRGGGKGWNADQKTTYTSR